MITIVVLLAVLVAALLAFLLAMRGYKAADAAPVGNEAAAAAKRKNAFVMAGSGIAAILTAILLAFAAGRRRGERQNRRA